MAKKMELRPASTLDLNKLELLLAKGIEESKGLLPPYNPFVVYKNANELIHNKDGCVIILREVDDDAKTARVVGCLMLKVEGWEWNPQALILKSVHFYVLPESRTVKMPDGMLPAIAMLEYAKSVSCSTGMPLLIQTMHQAGDERAVGKDHMFERAGLLYSGGNFFYMPPPPAEQEGEAKAA